MLPFCQLVFLNFKTVNCLALLCEGTPFSEVASSRRSRWCEGTTSCCCQQPRDKCLNVWALLRLRRFVLVRAPMSVNGRNSNYYKKNSNWVRSAHTFGDVGVGDARMKNESKWLTFFLNSFSGKNERYYRKSLCFFQFNSPILVIGLFIEVDSIIDAVLFFDYDVSTANRWAD